MSDYSVEYVSDYCLSWRSEYDIGLVIVYF